MKETYAKNAMVFKAFCDERRLRILDLLRGGEKCTCVLIEEMDMPQSSLSYHMKILSDSGLVNARRDGAWMRYTLNKKRTDETLAFFTHITTGKEDCICKKVKSAL